jgi:hypothetical protein
VSIRSSHVQAARPALVDGAAENLGRRGRLLALGQGRELAGQVVAVACAGRVNEIVDAELRWWRHFFFLSLFIVKLFL